MRKLEEQYQNLLHQRELLNRKIYFSREDMHLWLKKNKQWKFWLMDFLIVFTLFSNFASGWITNTLVMKDPNTVLVESNPTVAVAKEYVTTPEANSHYRVFIAEITYFVVMAFGYIIFRSYVWSKFVLNAVLGIVVAISIMFGINFLNDFSYLFGEVWYG